MKGKYKKLGKEAAIYGFGRALARFIAIFLVPIYTRIFTPEQYGIIEMITVSFTFLGLFLNLGLDTALFFYFNREKTEVERQKTLGTVLIAKVTVNVTISILLIMLADHFSNLLFDTTDFKLYISLAAVTIIFANISSYFSNVFRLNFQPWRYFAVSVANVLFSVVVSIVLVVILRMGLLGVYLGGLATSVFILLLSYYLGHGYLSFKFSKDRLVQLLKYGLPLVPASISIWIMNVSNRFFINHYLDLHEVGLYSIGFRVASIVTFFAFAIRMALGPTIYEVSDDRDSAVQFYAQLFIYYSVAFYAIILFVSIFGREILSIFTTDAYIPAEQVIYYLAVSAAGFGMAQITSIGLALTKKTIHMSWPIMVGAGIAVGLNFVLIPLYGILGAGISTAAAFVIINILQYIMSQRYYFIPYPIGKFLILSSSVQLIYLISRYFNDGSGVHILIKIILFGIYLTSIAFMGIIPKISSFKR